MQPGQMRSLILSNFRKPQAPLPFPSLLSHSLVSCKFSDRVLGGVSGAFGFHIMLLVTHCCPMQAKQNTMFLLFVFGMDADGADRPCLLHFASRQRIRWYPVVSSISSLTVFTCMSFVYTNSTPPATDAFMQNKKTQTCLFIHIWIYKSICPTLSYAQAADTAEVTEFPADAHSDAGAAAPTASTGLGEAHRNMYKLQPGFSWLTSSLNLNLNSGALGDLVGGRLGARHIFSQNIAFITSPID